MAVNAQDGQNCVFQRWQHTGWKISTEIARQSDGETRTGRYLTLDSGEKKKKKKNKKQKRIDKTRRTSTENG